MGIPIVLVTGFLGSGKTSLINRVIEETTIPKAEIIIIVNELGEVGVDHHLMIHSKEQVFQLNNGCMCCNLRGDLLDTLQSIQKVFSREQRPLSQVVIETTGIADPRSIIQTLEGTALSHYYYLDSILTVVDCQNIDYTLANFPEAYHQILVADRFLLSKIDWQDYEQIAAVSYKLAEINPLADSVVISNKPTLPCPAFFNQSLFNHAPEYVEELPHHHHHQFQSIVLTYDLPISESLIVPWFDWLLYSFKENIYRFKGFLQVQNKDLMVTVHGVHTHYHFEMSNRLADEAVTQIVLIGRDLDSEAISQSFMQLIHSSKAAYDESNL
ncbi:MULTISPECIES: GTP-binding protein [unclassified Enterococcus]|uniref:CobW family GTP-binding protein n=1 Tax=unclassified Enterococcus TaxID=2608891 RepID=UPI00155657FA|nr:MULTISPECIES: GTP-binding protein [unclassified Enterococcus]MBS7576880.1 GTP-binding protein [Enterococcus sp. MMGLQ5-2]MBS7584287.1 GTP-binding protein [Enterococcus sp. MMGLQ5-1]NPD12143.1 GTP-binding protein [Enterococcus sp. MMGLQ5-1]NPD36715.1 GTP-binding protein [Enterococcus sp. MMGLQ5-2]